MSPMPFFKLGVIAGALALAGCGEFNATRESPGMHLYQAGLYYAGADLISLANTGKTIDDHIIGMATDQDCSSLRASQGGPWCQPIPAPVAMIARTEYCYRSLASTTCFTEPLPPYQGGFRGSRTDLVPAP